MANKNLSVTLKIGGAITGAFKSAIGQTRTGIDSIGKSITELTKRQKELDKELSKIGKNGVHDWGGAAQLRAQYAQEEFVAIGKQITALKQREAVLAKGAAMRATGASRMASGGMMIGGALAMAATLGAPARAAADLEHKLQLIGNTANMTKVEIANLSDQIFRVSKVSNQSTDDVTRAIGFLVAAGMDVKTAVASLETVAKGATAAGADVEDLAKAAYSLNDSLNIEPESLNAALNILAKAGKQGNVELKDMAKQLPVLGAGFKALKMEGPEAAATMGAALQIARKGAADADEAANNMKNFIAKIMSPETLKKAKKEFGIDLYKVIQDAQTKGENPFEASMRAIIKMTKGDQKAIGELFGDMQVQNFLRPMIQQWEEYQRIKRESMTPEDVLAEDFRKMMETMKEATKGLGNSWQRLMITMGTTYGPVIGDVAKSLTGALDSLQAFTKANPETVRAVVSTTGVVIGLTAALGVGRMAVGGIGYALGAIPPLVTAAGTAFTWMAGTAIPAVVTGIRAIGLAMAANPVGALVTGLVAGAALVAANWETVTKVFRGVGDAIGSVWSKAKSVFGFTSETASTGGQRPAIAAAPPMPVMRAGGANVTNHVSAPFSLTITQQPGQDSRALADEVIRKLDQREQARRRGGMFDHAMGY